MIVSPTFKLVLKPNKTRVISANLLDFDFDFVDIIMLGIGNILFW